MPWPFFIPEFLKRRACRYLLHYYLGQFLEEKISLSDLTIDLYNGTGSVNNVPLNVETINEVLEEARAPVQVVSGYIGCITISVPWSSLMSSSCKVEISGLNITVSPSYLHYGDQVSMTDSLFFNMSSSRRLAEEVLKTPPSAGEENGDAEEEQGFEGMEVLAKAIEAILLRVQISLVDTTITISHRIENGPDCTTSGVKTGELSVHIERVEFFDELTQMEEEESAEQGGQEAKEGKDGEYRLPEVGDFATKVLQLFGFTLELNTRQDAAESSVNSDTHGNSVGVPIACASGEVDVKVKIRQSDNVQGPKLDVQVQLESVHMLLYPQQLHVLLEMVAGITKELSKSKPSDNSHQSRSHSHAPGQSRPIPKQDMRTIETQLMNHIDTQKKKKMAEEELLQLDPWDISARRKLNHMTESTCSNGSELFYSFDLQNQGEEKSINRNATNDDKTFVGCDGIGLEQVVPPQSRLHPEAPPPPHGAFFTANNKRSSSFEDVCVYSITLGGFTCAILESTPVHTHVTRSTRRSSNESINDSDETDSYSSAVADSRPSSSSLDSNGVKPASELCSLDEGGLDPFKYFDCVNDVLKGRVSRREIKSCENKLGQILPADHIFLWMSAVNTRVFVEGASTDFSLTVASAELLEYLYHNEANLPLITPVSIQPLIQFQEDCTSSDPCVSIQVTSSISSSSNGSGSGHYIPSSSPFSKSKHSLTSSPMTTDIEVSLTHLHLYLDVTIIDRLHALIYFHQPRTPPQPATLSPSTYGTPLYCPSVITSISGNQRKFVSQVLFSEAMSSTNSTASAHRLSLKIKTKSTSGTLRFPVADLRQTVHPPWYRPSLRKEILFLEFADLSLSSNIITPIATTKNASATVSFRTAKTYFSQDGSHENRQLFVIIKGDSTATKFANSRLESVDMPSIKVVYQMFDSSPLDSNNEVKIALEDSDDEEFNMSTPLFQPSPFSQRRERVLFTSDNGKSDDGVSSCQSLVPASPEEMQQYESYLSATSQYAVFVSIPSIDVHIPSKQFLETLYNRIAMDLMLWQPTSPSNIEKATARSIFYSSADILQPAMSKEEKFKLCKSVLREDDSEEENDPFTFSSLISPPTSNPPKAPTYLMTSLNIDRGTVSLVLPVKTEGTPSIFKSPSGSSSSDSRLLDLSPQHSHYPSADVSRPVGVSEERNGLMVVEMKKWHICAGINYEGEPERTQMCCKVDSLNVKHCGCLPLQPSPFPLVDPETLKLEDVSYLDSILLDVLTTWDGGGEDRHQPVLLLSVDSRTEKDINRRVHKVAFQLSNALFHYQLVNPQHAFLQQCGNFFQLREISVPGFEPPMVISEVCISLEQSGLQYRPLELSTHGVLTFDTLSLSSTLVTDSPLLVVDLLIDQMRLFVSNKQHDTVNLRKDFVCVLEMNAFQMALRLCNKEDMTDEASKLFSHIPDMDLQCSGSELHFMFCVDSCCILRDMIIHLAMNGRADNPAATDDTELPLNKERDDGRVFSEEKHSIQPHPHPPPPPLSRPHPPVLVSSTINDLISEAMDDDDEDTVLTNTKTTTITNSGLLTNSRLNRSSTVSSSAGSDHLTTSPRHAVLRETDRHGTTTMVFSSDSEAEEVHPRHTTVPMVVPAGGTGQGSSFTKRDELAQKMIKQKMAEEWEIDKDDYCILSSPTTTKVGPSAEPVVKCLLAEGESFELINNYYAVPDMQVDQLKRPKHFPSPVSTYALRELTIIWHLYGGRDFSVPPTAPPSSMSPGTLKKHKMMAANGEKQLPFHSSGGIKNTWKRRGGPGRDHDVLMELELCKLRLQYECFPEDVEQCSRVVLLIHDIEIRDRLAVSRINKFLYHYATEARPRQSHANMFSFKVLMSHPESESRPASEDSFQSLEATVHLSMLPIRLNIDQDAILFLHEFFDDLLPNSATPPSVEDHTVVHSSSFPTSDSTDVSADFNGSTTEQAPLSQAIPAARISRGSNSTVYIKSFVFYPDVTIRIDYEAKRFHSKQLGTFTGMLLGLSHLDNSEVTLKSLTYKNGVLGWNQLFEKVTFEWMQDIQRYQLPRILQGVGPVYHVTQLFQGALDLFWLPVQQYQDDGRIFWGIQRGANSFVSSSGMAVVELSNRMLQSVETIAKTAFDMVSTKERREVSNQSLETPPTHQPADLREGIVNAYNVVSTGIGDTAWDLYDAACTEHNEYGVTGAVGGVLKNIPGTIVRPIIFMSEATRHVLGGMKNQFVPEARREANDKYKNQS